MLFHLSDELVALWFDSVGRYLASGGRYWANINVVAEESHWLHFPFINRSADFYGGLAGRNSLSMIAL